jgi:hypothetical protein
MRQPSKEDGMTQPPADDGVQSPADHPGESATGWWGVPKRGRGAGDGVGLGPTDRDAAGSAYDVGDSVGGMGSRAIGDSGPGLGARLANSTGGVVGGALQAVWGGGGAGLVAGVLLGRADQAPDAPDEHAALGAGRHRRLDDDAARLFGAATVLADPPAEADRAEREPDPAALDRDEREPDLAALDLDEYEPEAAALDLDERELDLVDDDEGEDADLGADLDPADEADEDLDPIAFVPGFAWETDPLPARDETIGRLAWLASQSLLVVGLAVMAIGRRVALACGPLSVVGPAVAGFGRRVWQARTSLSAVGRAWRARTSRAAVGSADVAVGGRVSRARTLPSAADPGDGAFGRPVSGVRTLALGADPADDAMGWRVSRVPMVLSVVGPAVVAFGGRVRRGRTPLLVAGVAVWLTGIAGAFLTVPGDPGPVRVATGPRWVAGAPSQQPSQPAGAPGPVDPDTSVSGRVEGLTSAAFNVVDPAGTVTIRAASLGDDLFRVVIPAGSDVTPRVQRADGDVRLYLPGEPGGPASVDIVLNADVRWTLRLDGGAVHKTVDLTAAEVDGVELGGGARTVELALPAPRGVMPVRMVGGVDQFRVRLPDAVPIRVRVRSGAGAVTLGGSTHRGISPGEAFTANGWGGDAGVDLLAEAGLTALTVIDGR